MAGREFYEESVTDRVNDEAGVRGGLHHAETVKPMFVDRRNHPCQFNSKPIGVRESQVSADGVVCGSTALEAEGFQESVFKEPAIHKRGPIIVLIQEFVSRDKILNEEVNGNCVGHSDN